MLNSPHDRPSCPVCGATVEMPRYQAQEFVSCYCCGAELKPRYTPARGFLYYAMLSTLVFLSVSLSTAIMFFPTVLCGVMAIVFAMARINASSVREFLLRNEAEDFQFSLLTALHAMIVIGVLYGLITHPDERVQVCGGAWLIGNVVESARYLTMRKAQKSE